jgi:anti-anti-sigma regulatory factor
VLRISFVNALDKVVTLRLEGQVRGPWVEALSKASEQVLATGSELILDLTEVSFIDMAGIALCHRLRDRNVAFLHCSPFVAEQLKE